MEELKKPNQLEDVYAELETSCTEACAPNNSGCACRRNPESVQTEEEILF